MLPSCDILGSIDVNPLEANLHTLDLLHRNCLSYAMKDLLDAPRDQIKQRILPMRVEPKTESFPTMTRLPISAAGEEIATVLRHLGVYELALTDLSKWRTALAAAQVLRCAEETVSIAWPTWSAAESDGRGGPVTLEKQ